MTDAAPFQPLPAEPDAGRFQVSMVPFDVALADLSLPAAGAAAVTADVFLLIPGDHVIDRVFAQITGEVENQGIGTVTISLVQAQADGFVDELTAPLSLNSRKPDVLELPLQRERMQLGLPIYLRFIASSPTSGGTPWYLTADLRLVGTLHFYLE